VRRVTSIKFDRKVDTVEVQHASSITVVLQDQKGVVFNADQVDSSAVRVFVADTNIATVVPNGLVPQNTGLPRGFVDVITGHRPGTTTLTFSVNGITSSLPIVVLPTRIASITYPTTSYSLTEGDTLTLPAPKLIDGSGAIATGRTLTYVSNSSILTVSLTGLVTAVGAGSGTITVTADTARTTLSFTVQAASIAGVKLVPSVLYLGTGHTIATRALALSPDGGSLYGRQYTYSVDNPSVASVSVHGIVQGIAPGKATLTVRTGSASVAVPISVATLAPAGFKIDLRFVGSVSSAVKTAAAQAAQRWETVISAPLIPYHVVTTANLCGDRVPAVDTTETSMMIIIQSDSIDGRSNTVGLGGPLRAGVKA